MGKMYKIWYRLTRGKSNPTMNENNIRPMKRGRKIFLSSICMVLSVFIVLFGFVFNMLGRINTISIDKIKHNGEYTDIFNTFESEDPNQVKNGYEEVESLDEVKIEEGAIISDKDVQNILLIGDDSSTKGETGRSDTQIILSIDRRNKQIKMTSLLRDSYVAIPGKGSNRINAAYNSGGVKLAKETIEQNFKVKIDNYAKVGFNAFRTVINKMGGITVKLSAQQAEYMSTYGKSNFPKAGQYKLSGYDALEYVRMRRFDNDFYRTSRQRAVMEQLLNKIKNYNAVDLTQLMYDLLPSIQTDLTQAEILGLITEVVDFAGYEIKQFSIPAKGTWEGKMINHMDVLVIDVAENARRLGKFIYTADFDPNNP